MFFLVQILSAAAVSAMAAALSGAVAVGVSKLPTSRFLGPFILACGYASGHFFITGWVSIPPVDTINWLPVFAFSAAAVGAGLPLLPHRTARVVVSGILVAGAIRLLLDPQFRYVWTRFSGWMWVIALIIVVLLLEHCIEALSRRSRTWIEMPLLLFISCAGTSLALSLSGSILLGQFAAILGATLVGMLLLGWRRSVVWETFGLVFALLFIAIITSGYFFSELPAASALLLGIAPALALIPVPAPGPLRALGARALLISIPIALAIFMAFRSSSPDEISSINGSSLYPHGIQETCSKMMSRLPPKEDSAISLTS